jgi:hypothetical protein
MNLSHDALDVAYALRMVEGSDVVGVGPDIATLVQLDKVAGKSGSDIRIALNELQTCGLIRISGCIGTPREGVPKELRDVAKVSILEPLQQMFDEMGL